MHVLKARNARPTVRNPDQEQLARATGRMQAQKLMDLIDETAPDEGVVDVHALETSFANGSRRIELVEPDDGAVVPVAIEGAADTTRRMSAVEWDAAISAVESEVHSESTLRMSAIQASELAALITPVEVSVEIPLVAEPVVTFTTPRISLPLPAPVEEASKDVEISIEQVNEPAVAPPARRGMNPWMIGALIALAGAVAGLAAVLVS